MFRVLRLYVGRTNVHGGITHCAAVFHDAYGTRYLLRLEPPIAEKSAAGAGAEVASLHRGSVDTGTVPPGCTLMAFELGFDAAHDGDWTPATAKWAPATAVYRDAESMANECRRLAADMHAAMHSE